ncbi:MAG: hypothetical protein II892_00290 [Fibrobacter sp.]|nr:hypothetical protein [Fibrobacter sp.]
MPEELLSDEDDPSAGSGFLTLLLDDPLSLRGFEDEEEIFLLLLVSTLPELEDFSSLALLDDFLSLRGAEDEEAIFLLLDEDASAFSLLEIASSFSLDEDTSVSIPVSSFFEGPLELSSPQDANRQIALNGINNRFNMNISPTSSRPHLSNIYKKSRGNPRD